MPAVLIVAVVVVVVVVFVAVAIVASCNQRRINKPQAGSQGHKERG